MTQLQNISLKYDYTQARTYLFINTLAYVWIMLHRFRILNIDNKGSHIQTSTIT